jgi:hypothetical protein
MRSGMPCPPTCLSANQSGKGGPTGAPAADAPPAQNKANWTRQQAAGIRQKETAPLPAQNKANVQKSQIRVTLLHRATHVYEIVPAGGDDRRQRQGGLLLRGLVTGPREWDGHTVGVSPPDGVRSPLEGHEVLGAKQSQCAGKGGPGDCVARRHGGQEWRMTPLLASPQAGFCGRGRPSKGGSEHAASGWGFFLTIAPAKAIIWLKWPLWEMPLLSEECSNAAE